jgi:ABC-type cobalamin transport system ATPase subunit
MHNPDILLLDEPYNGLDLRAAEQLDGLLDELILVGHTLLITTHDLHRSLARARQVVILAGGRMIYRANTQDLTPEALQDIYKQAFR